jgi:hypothetical protein
MHQQQLAVQRLERPARLLVPHGVRTSAAQRGIERPTSLRVAEDA